MDEREPSPWVDGLTIGAVFHRTAECYAQRDALVFPWLGHRRTWAELWRDVETTAKGLLALGLGKGDHVAVWATNVPEWILLQYATARIGAVLVTVNPAYRAHELRYVLAQSDAAALFLVERFKTSDYFAMLAEVCPELATGGLPTASFPKLRHVVAIRGTPPTGARSWDDVLAGGAAIPSARLDDIEATLSATEPINIQYTSGTTGFPKAATLSHRNILLNGYYVGACQRLTADDRLCVPVPFYHCFGCVMGTLCCAAHGAAMIVPAESFHAGDALAAIEQERATAVYGVPTMFIALLADPTCDRRDLRSLRTGIMAGAPCPIEVMRQVIDRLGARELTIAYGQTEASPVVTQTRTEDPLELRVETVGRTIPGFEAKIIDSTGRTLGDNEQGEFCARGHGVMIGYYKNPEATRAALDADGWLHTGDLAIRLPNGYYKITGRLKDLVIRGGENIYPREIEEYLFTHPAVEQSAVVGVPDPRFGEELCAWVKLKPGASASEEEIREHCRARLAHYKVPRYVRFVPAFPQTVTGKIRKVEICEIMMRELGLSQPETA